MTTITDLTTIADTLRGARQKFEAHGEATNDFAKWLSIAAAIFGALLLMRALHRISGLAFGLFWVWFWTRGAWRHIF